MRRSKIIINSSCRLVHCWVEGWRGAQCSDASAFCRSSINYSHSVSLCTVLQNMSSLNFPSFDKLPLSYFNHANKYFILISIFNIYCRPFKIHRPTQSHLIDYAIASNWYYAKSRCILLIVWFSSRWKTNKNRDPSEN